MKIEIVKATEEMIDFGDFYEEGNNIDLLRDAFVHSLDCWAGLIDGAVVAIWGVIAPCVLSDDVYVWLTGNKLIQLHPLIFARYSREALRTLEAYPRVRGLVLCDFALSQRWLKWLGFELGEPCGKVIPFKRDKLTSALVEASVGLKGT